jgi:hypothetical protein
LTIKKKNFAAAAARPKIKLVKTLKLLFQNKKTGFNNVAVLEKKKKEEKENHSKRQREQTRDRKWQTNIGRNDDIPI